MPDRPEGAKNSIPAVVIRLELDDAHAWALAQLVKRIGWADCRGLAEGDEQAELMIQATERVRTALAEVGYAPR